MSPIPVALIARAVILLALVVVGGAIGNAVMAGVVAAVGASVPDAVDAERLVVAYRFPATLLGVFMGVGSAQVALRRRRQRLGETSTVWLAVALAAACALIAPALLWLRAGAAFTEYPALMRGVSLALTGFLPPVALLSAAAWWWVTTALPLPEGRRRVQRAP